MPDDSKVMKWGVTLAVLIIVVRIVLEQARVPDSVSNIFGVAWLYILLPILFALGIRARNAVHPYRSLLKAVFLFAVYTRVMVMLTYMLAYAFQWQAMRFKYPGGNVGGNVGLTTGLFVIPLRNVFIWVVIAIIVGMITGSVALLLRRGTVPSIPSGDPGHYPPSSGDQ
jgi:hypothetical protein